MKLHISVVAVLLAVLPLCFAEVYTGLSNAEVRREVDLSHQFVSYSTSITLRNDGDKPQSEAFYTIPEEEYQHLSFIAAVEGQNPLRIEFDHIENEHAYFRVQLGRTIDNDEATSFVVQTVFTHVLNAYPASIPQNGKQYMLFVGNHYYCSPYKTQTQTSVFHLPMPTHIEWFSELSPFQKSDSKISFGPYNDIAPFSVSELSIHYENGLPFIVATKLQKTVEISQWGNVAVEEHYDIKNDGAALKGQFSRTEFQRNPQQFRGNAALSLKAILPAAAVDVYYRDDIGNISSSHLIQGQDRVEVDIIPRFPLYGGWKIYFYMGYNLPAAAVLRDAANPDTYVVSSKFFTCFQGVIVEDFELRFILPEGAEKIDLQPLPFSVETGWSVEKTYLDTTGRPVFIAKKKNLVPSHAVDASITYNYTTAKLLKKPILLVLAFFAVFVFGSAYSRFNLSLKKQTKTKNE